jgi:hypothetical protein
MKNNNIYSSKTLLKPITSIKKITRYSQINWFNLPGNKLNPLPEVRETYLSFLALIIKFAIVFLFYYYLLSYQAPASAKSTVLPVYPSVAICR